MYRSIIDGAALSLCGRLKEHDNQIPEGVYPIPSVTLNVNRSVIIIICYAELFVQYQVSFQDFCSNPTLFNNPNLVVRLAGK